MGFVPEVVMMDNPAERAPRWAELPEPIAAHDWTTLHVVSPVPGALLEHSGPIVPFGADGGADGGDG